MGNETKIAELGGNFEPLGNGHSLDVSENYPMQPEVSRIGDELALTQRGRDIVETRAYKEYAWLNSDELAIIKESIKDGSLTPGNVESRFTKSVLFHLPSQMTFEDCPEVLELLVAGQLKLIDELIEEDQEPDALLKKRMVASIFEELSTITSGEASEAYELEALTLNSQLIDSKLPELDVSSRKTHAAFSNIDIRFRRLQKQLGLGLLEKFPENEVLALQTEFYDELIKLIAQAHTLGGGNGDDISGAIGEFLVLGRIRDRIIKRGCFERIEASQSFLRQDRTDGNHTTNRNRLPKRVKQKKAFDLTVVNKETGHLSRIEVKKRTRTRVMKVSQNGKLRVPLNEQVEWEAEKRKIKSDYLPSVDVIAYKLGGSFDEYCALASAHCEGRIAGLSGREKTNAQAIASMVFGNQVDGQITNIFARRKLLAN